MREKEIGKAGLKVLFVSNGGRLAPATRYRIYQFIPFMEKEGIDYKIYSIISENATRKMIRSSRFRGLRKVVYYTQIIAERFMRGWKIIFLAGRFDVVFIQRATFVFGMERLVRARNKNIIFDIDDSIYMPDTQENGFLGWAKKYSKKREVISVLRISKCVIAENEHIKNFVSKYCNKVCLITGPIDTIKNYPGKIGLNTGEVTIGWIGSPSTAVYLKLLDNVFKELNANYRFKLRLIGSGAYRIEGVNVETVDWSEESEVSQLHKFDIGVMPMPDNEWTRGKVGCKMLQYMANGIPAVVSYTPTNAEIIEDGVNGFLASLHKEWVEKLSLLMRDGPLRIEIATAGRKSVEERFSLEEAARKCIEIIKEVSEGN